MKRPLIAELDRHSPRVESFRVLRTNLQFLDVDSESKIFAITSPMPGDGKSTTAINIAITLAQTGKAHAAPGSRSAATKRRRIPEPGIRGRPDDGADRSRAGIVDVIQPWGRSGLDVMTSGAIPPNPAELLQSKAMALVLADLQHRDTTWSSSTRRRCCRSPTLR